MAEVFSLHFEGPFSWTGGDAPQLSESPLASSCGIYLWTVPTSVGELVEYVGQTGRTFGKRFDEHLRSQLSGEYTVRDPDALLQGRRVMLWPGLWGSKRAPSIIPFARQLTHYAPALERYITIVRFHLAATTVEARMRERIEAAIADHLRKQPDPIRSFQDDDVIYHRRRSDAGETPVEVRLSTLVPLRGFPESVLA